MNGGMRNRAIIRPLPIQKWDLSFKGSEIGFCEYPSQKLVSQKQKNIIQIHKRLM